MGTWKLNHIDISVDEVEFRASAQSKGARFLLGGSQKSFKLDELKSIYFKDAKGLNGGTLELADSEWSLRLGFAITEREAADEILQELKSKCPNTSSEKSKASRWMESVASKKEKQADFTQHIEEVLQSAVEASARHDIVLEHELTIEALKLGKESKLRGYAPNKIQELIKEGKLRKGAELIGIVGADKYVKAIESGTFYWHEHEASVPIQVYNDRVLQGGLAYPIDETTAAQVYLDGQQQITQHVQAWDIAALSIFPGSSLGPAMAMQKSKVNDMRTAEFHVASPNWHLRTLISPNYMGEPRAIAERINRISEALKGDSIKTSPSASQSELSDVEQLERVAQLLASGVLSVDEAAAMKKKIIEA